MKFLGIIFLIFVIGYSGEAQSYKTAAGLRIGNDISLSLSQRIVKRTTLDLYHQTGLFTGQNVTTLAVKQHFPLISKRLNVFAGIGPYYNTSVKSNFIESQTQKSNAFGLAFPLGMDFTVGRLNIAFDYLPALKLAGINDKGIISASSAITLRYVIIKQDGLVKRTKTRLKKK